MFEASKLLLDNQINRRTFIARLTQAGMTLAGATTVANSLIGTAAGAATDYRPGQGRVLENMTGGEVMAEMLIDWDVPYVFGLAGSEEVGFLDALVDRPQLKYATCLHEHVAMGMADGYSRSTGKTSIVQLHSVAGSAYALGLLVGSYRDRIPVVVTAGRQASDFRGQDGFLEAESLHTLPEYYSRWTWDVTRENTIPHILRRAFMLAEAPPGGPTFVTFSKDLWERRIERAEILPRSRSRNTAQVVPSDEHIKRIADYLIRSQRPAILMGNECARHEVSSEVAEIAERVGAMVMTANKVGVVFPNTHPNFGGHFINDTAPVRNRVDAFWSIGAPMFKTSARTREPLIPREAAVMHTSLVYTEVGQNYPVDVAAIAGIQATTRAVLEELKHRNLKTSSIRARQRWFADYAAKRRQAVEDKAKEEWNNQPVSTSRMVMELDKVMGPDAYVVSEVVTSENHIRNYLAFDHRLPPGRRRRNFDTTAGILGWGLPAAIGVKIGNPHKEVWCLTADGCLNFASMGLWSAARYEVPIGIVVFNNGQYQANRLNQNSYKGRMVETGKYIGVSLKHPDIDHVAMAATYGIEGERVEDPAGLADAYRRCRRAMQEGRPYLVDVVIETYFQGKDSTYYDFFSVAKLQAQTTA